MVAKENYHQANQQAGRDLLGQEEQPMHKVLLCIQHSYA